MGGGGGKKREGEALGKKTGVESERESREDKLKKEVH